MSTLNELAQIRLNEETRIETFVFDDDKSVPNSTLPVLLYHQVLHLGYPSATTPIEVIEARLRTVVGKHGWSVSWIAENMVDRRTHLHSRAHTVMWVLDDVARILVGGFRGKELRVSPGDALALPAGVAMRRLDAKVAFTVAKMVPIGQAYDVLRQNPGDYALAKKNIPLVPLPRADPFFGPDGPLMKYWNPKP